MAAELAIGFVVTKAADKLSRLLIQESAVLGGVERQVEWIERELRLLQAYLEDAERSRQGGGEEFIKWVEELNQVANEADDVCQTFLIKSVKRRRIWVLYLWDRYKVGNELQKITHKMRDISQRRKNHDYQKQQTNKGAHDHKPPGGGETSASASAPSTIVAQAVEKLSNLLSLDLITRSKVINKVEQARDALADLQNVVSSLKLTSQREDVWLEEVQSVCDLTERVAEDFMGIATRLGRPGHVLFPCRRYAFDRNLRKQIMYVSNQIGDALHRWLTYGVGEVDFDLGDKIRTRSSLVPNLPLGRLLIVKVPIIIFYVVLSIIARDDRITVQFFMTTLILEGVLFGVTGEFAPTKEKKEKELTTLAFMFSVLIDFALFVVPVEIALLLELGSLLYAVIIWTASLWRSMDRNLKSTQRDLALMRALFSDIQSAQGLNERQKVWLEQLRLVAQSAPSHIDAANRKSEFFSRLILAKDINGLLYEIRTISDRKKIYCISNMDGRNGLVSVGPSIQVRERESETNSNVVEHDDNSGNNNEQQSHAPAASLYRRVTALAHKVRSIRGEMQLMDALFQDVQENGELDGRSEVWVQQMRGIAHEAKSVINDYAKKLEHKPIHIHILNYRTRLVIHTEIDKIRKKIHDAGRRRNTYGLVQFQTQAKPFSVVQRLHARTQPSLIVKESGIIGFYDDVEVLMAHVLSDKERHSIVSIVGIRGIGKTTLAELIFRSNVVREVFEYGAWVRVRVPQNENRTAQADQIMGGQEDRLAQLVLNDVAEQIMGGQEESWTTQDKIQALRTLLGSKRCLIVLDGIETYQALDALRKTILDLSTACKLLLTSRVANMELLAGTITFVHQLQLLDDENSWILFKRDLKVGIPPELIEVGKKIVVKCGGLPIEISTMSGLLSQKDATHEEWSKVLEELNQDRKPWVETLKTINLDLPRYLRRCLFYFLLFRAEFGIPVRRLVALWVAEGLVHQGEHEEPPEQVAEKYLTELIDLNMVQIAKRKRNGKVKTCRLPNALRELWLTEANESRFLLGHNATDSDSVPKDFIIRRVADHLDENDIWHNHIHSTTRSSSALLRSHYKDVLSFLSFHDQEGSKPGQDIGNFLSRCISSSCFSLLRVLDLERVYKPRLPKSIGRLSRLRYLGLRWTYLESLPSSIGSLLKLQTLDLKHTYINVLTRSIWLMELRHLFLSETYRSRFPPQPKGNSLSDLQTLWGLFVDEQTPVKGGLDRLVNIRKLGLACQSMSSQPGAVPSQPDPLKPQLEAVADWLVKLEHLQSLRLKSRDEQGRPWTLPLKSLENHMNLTDMYLLGILTSSSILSVFPPSLIELTLSHSKLMDDPMQILKDLPNLRSLCLLAESYVGKTLVCKSGSFPQLHVLKLWRLEQLEEWTIEQEALPGLRQMEIRLCQRLKMLPDGLEHVSTLLELSLTNMPMEIKSRVSNEDRRKISHIPNVCIHDSPYIVASQNYDTINLGILPKASVTFQSGESEAEITCTWKFPPMGWVCMNSAGSVIRNSEAACGGLVRDEAGLILGGFSANLGVTSITIAELWGILHGLNVVWRMGWRKVKVDIDSRHALSLIQTSSSHDSHPASSIIQRIKDLLKRHWTVEFCHIQPEANRAADKLAQMGHDLQYGVQDFISPPTCLADVIGEDLAGVCQAPS